MKELRLLLFTMGTTFIVMLLYQIAKETLFQGALTPWQSHWITIFTTTLLSGLITLLASNRLNAYRERSQRVQLHEEKLKTLNQVMRLVRHHVNDLGNNLQLVEIEVNNTGRLEEETVKILLKAVERTSEEIKRLSDIQDPFDEESFEIRYH